MRTGSSQMVITILIDTFNKLGIHIPMFELENLAVTIHKAMTVQGRVYHTLEHVFSFWDPEQPIQSLAALFHDIVYYHVDQGIASDVRLVLDAFIDEADGQVQLAMPVAEDRLYALTLAVFRFQAGQELTPADGLNEFLSALFMNKKLEGIVSELCLFKMTVCIEATIPFRDRTSEGVDYFDSLEKHLTCINQEFGFGLSLEEVQEMVRLAVRFANRDMINFSEPDPARFLEQTWKLLPETNIALRAREIYSIRDYRLALEKMAGFMAWVKPGSIFHRYQGCPPENEFEQMIGAAVENISTARVYLQVKLVAMAILEALAEVTGGDAPLALFMGDLPEGGVNYKRLEDILPKVTVFLPGVQSAAILHLLADGRKGESGFDTNEARLSLFVYQSIHQEEIAHLEGLAQRMFTGDLSAEEFLCVVPMQVVSAIAKAGSAMVLTRREQLLRYVSVE
jgi:hypothetical protein